MIFLVMEDRVDLGRECISWMDYMKRVTLPTYHVPDLQVLWELYVVVN